MHNAQGKGGFYRCFSARDGIRKSESDSDFQTLQVHLIIIRMKEDRLAIVTALDDVLRHVMSSTRQYITEKQGERIGVLLDLDEYQQLTSLSPPDVEILGGLSEAELQALAQAPYHLRKKSA